MKESYDITLVGSSLGGFYSIYLSEKYNLKAVLINPSVEPWVTMKKHIGEHKNFDTSMYSLIPGKKIIIIIEIKWKVIYIIKTIFLIIVE